MAHKLETDKWQCDNRFEIYGSAKAISNLYFNLSCLERLHQEDKHPSACPRFIDILNKDGVSVLEDYKKHGLGGLCNINTFE